MNHSSQIKSITFILNNSENIDMMLFYCIFQLDTVFLSWPCWNMKVPSGQFMEIFWFALPVLFPNFNFHFIWTLHTTPLAVINCYQWLLTFLLLFKSTPWTRRRWEGVSSNIILMTGSTVDYRIVFALSTGTHLLTQRWPRSLILRKEQGPFKIYFWWNYVTMQTKEFLIKRIIYLILWSIHETDQ